MSGTKAVFSEAGVRTRGAGPDEMFQLTLVPTSRSYPGYVTTEEGPDYSLTKRIEPYTTHDEPDLVLTGNLTRVTVTLDDDGGAVESGAVRIEDGHLKKLSSSLLGTTVRVRASTRFLTREVSYTFSSAGEDDAITALGLTYRPGTLGRELEECLTARLPPSGASVATNCQFLDGGTYDAGNVVVSDNPSFFLSDIDWSGISVASTGTGYGFPFTLISPRHVLFAAHTKVGLAGSLITFRRPNGTTQTVTVLAESRLVTGSDSTSPDLGVAYLDAPVTGCGIFKLPPTDFEQYFPAAIQNQDITPYRHVIVPSIVRAANNGQAGNGLFGNVVLNSNSPKFLVTNTMRYVPRIGGAQRAITHEHTLLNPLFFSHYRAIYSGDSGSPVFWLLRETQGGPITPVLLSAYHFGGGGPASGGPHYAVYSPWIQEQMDAMAVASGDAAVHTITPADFSRFTSYPTQG